MYPPDKPFQVAAAFPAEFGVVLLTAGLGHSPDLWAHIDTEALESPRVIILPERSFASMEGGSPVCRAVVLHTLR